MGDAVFRRLAQAMAQSGLADDPRFARATDRSAHADEIEHRDAARAAGAAEAPAYPVLKQVIKRASRTAIWLSERV